MLVALFAEDIDLLPKYFVTQILEDCTTPASAYDLIGGLFEAMNTNPPAGRRPVQRRQLFQRRLVRPNRRGWRLQGPGTRPASQSRRVRLVQSSAGSFWHALPAFDGRRRAPCLRRALHQPVRHHEDCRADDRRAVAGADGAGQDAQANFTELADRLHHFRVLDPACGSGNFLYIAYRELKRIEARIYERMENEFQDRRRATGQMRLSFLSAQNFYGLDILPVRRRNRQSHDDDRPQTGD